VQCLETPARQRQHLRSAPGNAVEEPPGNAAQLDQGITTVLGGRYNRISALAQRPRGSAQVRGPERRAVAADQHRERMTSQRPFERTVHAIAQIAAALGLKACVEALSHSCEKDLLDSRRTGQVNVADSRSTRGLERPLDHSCMQPGGALLA
jgi:HPt (histidine-containing phosphotransfer) domain-containing protein